MPVVSFSSGRIASPDPVSSTGEISSPTTSAQPNGYSVVLLDWLNSSFGDRLRGDDAVRKVLGTIPVRQKVAIFVLGTQPPGSKNPLTMISGFSDDLVDIASVLDDPLILPGPEIVESFGAVDARSGGAGPTANVQMQVFDWGNRITDTVRAFATLADYMARLAGKKSLIWLTNGFPAVIDGKVILGLKAPEGVYLKELDRVVARFNQLNITLHAVNTKGLSASGGRSYDDTLVELAERTGGTVFLGRNDIDTGVQDALDDMHAGYTLGFLAPDGAAAGMHRIRVQTSKRNVKLAYRESYVLNR